MRHLVPSCQVEFLQLLIIGALSPAAQPSQAILGRRDLSGPFGERKFCTFQNTRSSLSGRLIWAREWVGLLGHLVPSCKVEFLQLLHLGAQGPAAQPSSAQPSCAARRWDAQPRCPAQLPTNPAVQPYRRAVFFKHARSKFQQNYSKMCVFKLAISKYKENHRKMYVFQARNIKMLTKPQ